MTRFTIHKLDGITNGALFFGRNFKKIKFKGDYSVYYNEISLGRVRHEYVAFYMNTIHLAEVSNQPLDLLCVELYNGCYTVCRVRRFRSLRKAYRFARKIGVNLIKDENANIWR